MHFCDFNSLFFAFIYDPSLRIQILSYALPGLTDIKLRICTNKILPIFNKVNRYFYL